MNSLWAFLVYRAIYFSIELGRLFGTGNACHSAHDPIDKPWLYAFGFPFPECRSLPKRAVHAQLETHLKSWLDQFSYVLRNNEMIFVKADWPSWTRGSAALQVPAGSRHSIFKRHIQNCILKSVSQWLIVLIIGLSCTLLKEKEEECFLFGLD